MYRAKYEGELEIKQTLGSGRIKGVIKEFIERRVKLKLVEHVAEELSTAVAGEMSEKEKQLRK